MTIKRPKYLAANVKTLLERHDWSVSDLARRARVSRKTINNLLNGRHATQFDVLQKIADAFGLELGLMLLPRLPEGNIDAGTFAHLVDEVAKLPPQSLAHVVDFVDFESSRKR